MSSKNSHTPTLGNKKVNNSESKQNKKEPKGKPKEINKQKVHNAIISEKIAKGIILSERRKKEETRKFEKVHHKKATNHKEGGKMKIFKQITNAGLEMIINYLFGFMKDQQESNRYYKLDKPNFIDLKNYISNLTNLAPTDQTAAKLLSMFKQERAEVINSILGGEEDGGTHEPTFELLTTFDSIQINTVGVVSFRATTNPGGVIPIQFDRCRMYDEYALLFDEFCILGANYKFVGVGISGGSVSSVKISALIWVDYADASTESDPAVAIGFDTHKTLQLESFDKDDITELKIRPQATPDSLDVWTSTASATTPTAYVKACQKGYNGITTQNLAIGYFWGHYRIKFRQSKVN